MGLCEGALIGAPGAPVNVPWQDTILAVLILAVLSLPPSGPRPAEADYPRRAAKSKIVRRCSNRVAVETCRVRSLAVGAQEFRWATFRYIWRPFRVRCSCRP